LELFWPEAVEIELEAQFFRNLELEKNAGLAAQKRIAKLLGTVGSQPTSSLNVDIAASSSAYASRTQQMKAYLLIQSVPTVGPALSDLVKQAAYRIPPFEEITRGKGTAVIGFQDAVILSSVLGHLAANPTTAAFVSEDSIFSHARVKAHVEELGLDLRFYQHLRVLGDELWELVAPAIRRGWENDFARAREAVDANLATLEPELLRSLDLGDIGRGESAKVLEVRSARIKKVAAVQTDLPETKSLPPFSPEFSRRPGPTKIAATVLVEFDAIVRPYFHDILSLFSKEARPAAAEINAPEETRIIPHVIDLALEADYDGHKYGPPRLISATVQ